MHPASSVTCPNRMRHNTADVRRGQEFKWAVSTKQGHSRARVQWSQGVFSFSIINISRIKAQLPQLMLAIIISILCTPSPPRCSNKAAPKSFFLNVFHLDKMQEAHRLQWKHSAKSALLGSLTCYYTPKDKPPQGFRSSDQKLEWVSMTQIFQHQASTGLFTQSPNQTGLITTELIQALQLATSPAPPEFLSPADRGIFVLWYYKGALMQDIPSSCKRGSDGGQTQSEIYCNTLSFLHHPGCPVLRSWEANVSLGSTRESQRLLQKHLSHFMLLHGPAVSGITAMSLSYPETFPHPTTPH